MSKPVIILITIGAWAVGCAYTAYYNVTSILGPPCVTDTYACSWGFLLLMVGIFRFPLWVVGLLAVIFAEDLLLKPAHRKLR